MTELGQTIGNSMKSSDDLNRQFSEMGSVTAYFNLFQDQIQPEELTLIESQRTLGSSFILAHPKWGRLGIQTDGSQPYLGDSRGSWSVKRVENPNDTYKEFFTGSRFKA